MYKTNVSYSLQGLLWGTHFFTDSLKLTSESFRLTFVATSYLRSNNCRTFCSKINAVYERYPETKLVSKISMMT